MACFTTIIIKIIRSNDTKVCKNPNKKQIENKLREEKRSF